FGFQGRDVDDDAAAGVRGLAQAYGQHVARNLEVLDGFGQGEAVGRDDARIAFHVHEGVRRELLRVDDGAVDIGEDLEVPADAHVVAVTGDAERDDPLAQRLLGEGNDLDVLANLPIG